MGLHATNQGSGAQIADLFLRCLGALFAVAFASLAVQVEVLISSKGLLPLEPFLEQIKGTRPELSYLSFPTLFWLNASDFWINYGVWIGAVFGLIATAGVHPRIAIGICTALYLSYATACRDFLYFQWDNLIIECGFLAIFLPRNKRSDWIHFLFRILLFKLYMESGIAKWQSHLQDWHDGSAMTYYYETAPIPTALSWYFHHLPLWWHHLESRMTLAFELLIPLLIFAGRRLKLFAFLVFTLFQLVNIATANYGFFSYGALILHLFLLEERDLRLLPLGVRRKLPPIAPPTVLYRWDKVIFVSLFTTLYLGISLGEGIERFGRTKDPVYSKTLDGIKAQARKFLEPARPYYRPLRVINTYHLFGHITRNRTEAQFEVFKDGHWTELHMLYKPGPVDRAPPLVAPHQPRVDFRLWFYGLSHRRGRPNYVRAITEQLCKDPKHLQSLFETPLLVDYKSVRIRYWDYTYSSPSEKSETGQWWQRRENSPARTFSCPR